MAFTIFPFSRRSYKQPAQAWSRRHLYKKGFYIFGIFVFFIPYFSQPAAIERLVGVNVTPSESFIKGLFFVAIVGAAVCGTLWYRESRRASTVLHPLAGDITLDSLPKIDKLSAQTGVKSAMKRWLTAFFVAAMVTVVLVYIDIGRLLAESQIVLFIFVVALLSAVTLAAYAITSKPKIDTDGMLQTFAQRNGWEYDRPNELPLWAVSLASIDARYMTVNWRLCGQYRQQHVEIVLLAHTKRRESTFLIYVARSYPIDVLPEDINSQLRPLDGVIDTISPTGCSIAVSPSDSVYNQAAFSRLFAAIDVVSGK